MNDKIISKGKEEYGLSVNLDDGLISILVKSIHIAVRALAILMTLIIYWGVIDVLWLLYIKLKSPPVLLLTMTDILALFGGFLAVLIAIEIFLNIIMYLRDDIIHIKLVLATALMAIARKVIILDYSKHTPEYIWAIGFVILALSIGFWLVSAKPADEETSPSL